MNVTKRHFFATSLILLELSAALILFLTILALLVGGNWTSIYKKTPEGKYMKVSKSQIGKYDWYFDSGFEYVCLRPRPYIMS